MEAVSLLIEWVVSLADGVSDSCRSSGAYFCVV